MKKFRNTAYLKRVESRGLIYLYLAVSSGGKKKILFSFGRLEKSLDLMCSFREENKFPSELKSLGYGLDDLDQWIMTLQTGYSSRGKKIEWIFQFNKSIQTKGSGCNNGE